MANMHMRSRSCKPILCFTRSKAAKFSGADIFNHPRKHAFKSLNRPRVREMQTVYIVQGGRRLHDVHYVCSRRRSAPNGLRERSQTSAASGDQIPGSIVLSFSLLPPSPALQTGSKSWRFGAGSKCGIGEDRGSSRAAISKRQR